MTEVSELQKKRADNIIWNCAGDYSFTPDFKAYDADGNAELYWNIIIGAVRRFFDYPAVEALLYRVQDYEERALYEELIWLSVESAVYPKEAELRPVLNTIRKRYAEKYTGADGSAEGNAVRGTDVSGASGTVRGPAGTDSGASQTVFGSSQTAAGTSQTVFGASQTVSGTSQTGCGTVQSGFASSRTGFETKAPGKRKRKKFDRFRLLEDITEAYWLKVLGVPGSYAGAEEALVSEIPAPEGCTTEVLTEHIERFLLKWFQISVREDRRSVKGNRLPGLKKSLIRRRSGSEKTKYVRFGKGFAFHPENVYGGSTVSSGEKPALNTKLSASELREFMEGKYGRSLLSPSATIGLEKELCRGPHDFCHILYTDGKRIHDVSVRNGFEALERQREAAQILRNKEYYAGNRTVNKVMIDRLSANIRNSSLLHLHLSPVRSVSGSFDPTAAWRGALLDDNRVFIRQENDNAGELCVNILLDASTSQRGRQEKISSQGYIIAESLSLCSIPCRVMSFCSMTGYTVVRVFRDYNRPADNAKIFEFTSNGCNRDGLAIRIAGSFLSQAPYDHRILIVLSDVKPNDVVKLHDPETGELSDYDSAAGLDNTAKEVRRLRAEGISVLCIFTGEDEDLPSAKTVYGKDFVRIRSFDMLADTVGALIRNQIQYL